MTKKAIPGYKVLDELHRGLNTVIYRAIRITDNRSVILKTFLPGKERQSSALKLFHDYEILSKFSHPGIVSVIGIETSDNVQVLILEDFGATSLKTYLASRRIDIVTFLQIGIQLVSALEEIHRQNIIHKDINPSNIIINSSTGRVKIIDFGIASIIHHETTEAKSPEHLEGTLQYISPEQSGRMNRPIDYRSDYYSLGITFYEMLIGWVPFQSNDLLELIHFHLTHTPKPPSELNRDISPVISEIVMKLLSKMPESRYQSANGLKNDLERCLRHWQIGKGIEYFRPGEKDISDKFQIPPKLYGREECIEKMVQAFQRCSTGTSELLFLTGPAGIGKSSLIGELKKSVGGQHGFFISGKFDHVKRDVPYVAFTEAFQELIRQLMALPQTELQGWRTRILEALGTNIQVVIDVIPGLEVILGEHSPAPDLPAVESQNRLNRVFQDFLGVTAQPNRPLVISLDDFQWADSASARSVPILLSNPELRHLLIIISARDNELSSDNADFAMIEEVRQAGVTVTDIKLMPLSAPIISTIVMESLHSEFEESMALAALIHHKTEGNPYFVNEFLKYLHQKKVINFDDTSRSWKWDLSEIQRAGITDNVVSLMSEKIQKLSPEAIRMLTSAACIGSQFELNILALANEQTPVETAGKLWDAIQSGLIIPVGEAYKFIPGVGGAEYNFMYQLPTDYSDVVYKFSHDRVHQAAYSLIPDNRTTGLHLEIGYSLLKHSQPHRVDERIFEIVHQLNLARSLITDREKVIELAHLNLLAGKKAKGSIAFEAARSYLSTGAEMLDNSHWESNYNLNLEIHNELGECEYLLGQFENAEKRFDLNIKHARTNVEKASLYRRKVELYTHTGNYEKAVNEGNLGLDLVGEKISAYPGKLTVFLELAKSRLRVGRKKIDSFARLPEMSDPGKKVALEILMNFSTIGYSARPEFHGLITARKVNITLQHGLSDVSSYAFAVYGLLIGAAFGVYDSAVEFGKLAIQVTEQRNNQYYKGRINFVVGSVLNHWRYHVRTNLKYLAEATKYCSESADMQYLGYTNIHIIISSFYLGRPLPEILKKINEYIDFAHKIKYDYVRMMYLTYRQLTLNLMGQTNVLGSFDTDDLLDSDFTRQLEKPEFTVSGMYYSHHKVMSAYLFGDYRKVLTVIENSRPKVYALSGQIVEVDYYFFAALALIALQSTVTSNELRRLKRMIAQYGKKLKRWSHYCPENFKAKYLLITAEIARISGHFYKAMNLYDEAIQSAKENEFPNTTALANELTARFYLQYNKRHIARMYLREAVKGYSTWGATAKVNQLEEEFNELLTHDQTESISKQIFKTDTSTKILSTTVDYQSIIKVSQALSGEIVYHKMLTNMMNIVMENAGAERGFFIHQKNGRYIIAAAGTIREKHAPSILEQPLEESEDLSRQIVHYVARSRESVVLDDASEKGDFTGDSYVRRCAPRSVLCTPIIHQGKLAGILYLENNQISGAFTEERLEVLNLLSSQIAISIENAHLHEEEKELVRIREEVHVASRIQRDLLPYAAPVIPGYQICGTNIPAQIVGGDYYDYIPIDDTNIALCLGDVSGKGLPAALLMANLQATLRAQITNSHSVKNSVERSNKLLCRSTGSDRFITLFCGILDWKSNRFRFTNAGHDSPFFFNGIGPPSRLTTGSLVLGMLEDFPYEEQAITFEKGDLLVIYSDGIPEAMNERNEDFGELRFEELISNNRETPANELMDRIIDEVKNHIGTAPQSDDITLLLIQRTSN
jgi:predicted ATPase/serine phosphatase RsbU (regulator of sigma subunit)